MSTQDTTFANREGPLPLLRYDVDRLASADAIVDDLLDQPVGGRDKKARAASDGDGGNVRGGFQERIFSLWVT